jgi:hypothetical protein
MVTNVSEKPAASILWKNLKMEIARKGTGKGKVSLSTP